MELDLKNYNYEVRHVRTLNECINSLIQGYAGTVLPCDLEKYFVELVQMHVKHVGTGIFGADMDVTLTNWGPVTIVMDSQVLKNKGK